MVYLPVTNFLVKSFSRFHHSAIFRFPGATVSRYSYSPNYLRSNAKTVDFKMAFSFGKRNP